MMLYSSDWPIIISGKKMFFQTWICYWLSLSNPKKMVKPGVLYIMETSLMSGKDLLPGTFQSNSALIKHLVTILIILATVLLDLHLMKPKNCWMTAKNLLIMP